jgi:NhaA family Na+:H+ antiporter
MRSPDGRSPLIAAEHELKPWVLAGVMPIFALANAGAPLDGLGPETLAHPVTLGIALGLVLGKPLGIIGGAVFCVRVLKLPAALDARSLLGASMLAGIGFTMSLFIGALAFGDGALAAPTRIGVLIGSVISAAIGFAILHKALPPARASADRDTSA